MRERAARTGLAAAWVLAALVSAAIGASGCVSRSDTSASPAASRPASPERRALQPVSLPDLSRMEKSVQEQMRRGYALLRLKKSAVACDEACAQATRPDLDVNDAQITRLNGLLQGLEQTLLHPRGLPGRQWYRHMIYAPGLHTGYGVKTLPGVREAIEQRRWPEVDQYMSIIAGVLKAYSDRLEEVTAAVKKMARY